MNYSHPITTKSSFLEGLARVIDLGCSLDRYNYATTTEEADMAAIQSDWDAIAQDLEAIMGKSPGTK